MGNKSPQYMKAYRKKAKARDAAYNAAKVDARQKYEFESDFPQYFITNKQAGVLYAAMKDGRLDITQEQMDFVYNSFIANQHKNQWTGEWVIDPLPGKNKYVKKVDPTSFDGDTGIALQVAVSSVMKGDNQMGQYAFDTFRRNSGAPTKAESKLIAAEKGKAKAESTKKKSSFSAGSSVSHPKFGKGTVVEAPDSGGIVKVRFADGTEKKLMYTYLNK